MRVRVYGCVYVRACVWMRVNTVYVCACVRDVKLNFEIEVASCR